MRFVKQLSLFSLPPKKLVARTFVDSFHGDRSPNCLIRRVRNERSRYFVYWRDGQIERRDTYLVDWLPGEATLEVCEKRYSQLEPWILDN